MIFRQPTSTTSFLPSPQPPLKITLKFGPLACKKVLINNNYA